MMRKLSWMLLMPLAWVSLVHSGPWFVETATTTGGIILLLKSGNTSVEMINIVHLKNGSVIKGLIVEIILNEKIKIETPDGSVFVYEMSEVERPIELTVALES